MACAVAVDFERAQHGALEDKRPRQRSSLSPLEKDGSRHHGGGARPTAADPEEAVVVKLVRYRQRYRFRRRVAGILLNHVQNLQRGGLRINWAGGAEELRRD